MITLNELSAFAPRPSGGEAAKNWDAYTAALIEHAAPLCAEFGIDTALEWQHFMAQIGHESGGFTVLWENMNYRAERIMEIFGVGRHSAAVTLVEARKLAGKPEALADRVYGIGNPRKASELGNMDAGDGFKYRGFGPMQITGRRDHMRLLGGDHSPKSALRAALLEWDEKGCNALAAADNLKAITKKINGGYNGLEDRKAKLAAAKRIWPRFPGSPPTPEITTAQIKQVSPKAAAVDNAVTAVKIATGAAAVSETVNQTATPLAQATEHITMLNTLTSALVTFAGFMRAHALLIIIVVLVFLWWRLRPIIKMIIKDYCEGRYHPEKEVKP